MSEQVGLVAVLDLKDFNKNYTSYINSLRTMNLETGRVAGNLDNSFLGFGNSLLKIGAILSGAVLAGITAVGVAMSKFVLGGIRQAADMEAQLSNIAAVLNISNQEASVFKDTIIQLGLDPTLKVTAQESADVIEMLARNGLFAGMAIDEMGRAALDAGRATVMLANSTGADFSQAANIASTAMIVFNKEGSDLIDIVSNITAVTTNSKFTIHDYEVAMRNGAAGASAFGVSLEDFNTAMAASAEELGTGMKAGTGFRNFLTRLTPNTEKATQAMMDLGFVTADGKNIFFDSAGELKNMSEVSSILWSALVDQKVVTQEVSNLTADQQQLLADLRTEYKSAEQTIADYTTGIESITSSEAERNAAISEAQALMDLYAPKIAELESVTSDYITTTSQLTDEQRMVALETIFGADALNTAIALMREGEPIIADAASIVDALGVSWSEAALMVENGITNWDLLQMTMAKTDAVENAQTRMDNLRGRMEILDGIIETLSLRIGDAFVPIISNVIQSILDWVQENEGIIESIGQVADRIGEFIEALINGEGFISEFRDLLIDLGLEDVATKFDNARIAVENFMTPIITFVEENSAEIIAALEAIGIALLGFMALSALAGIGSLLLGAILSPITLILLAVGALGVAWETNFGGIREQVQLAIDKIGELLDAIGVTSAFEEGGIKGVFEEIPTILENIKTKLSEIDWLQVQTDIATTFTELGSKIAEKLNETDWSVVAETITTLISTAFATAGAIGGTIALAIYNLISTAISETDWSGVANEISTGIGNSLASTGVSDWFKNLKPNKDITDFITRITEGFDKLKEKLEPVISVFEVYSGMIKDSLQPALEDITDALPYLQNAWDSTVEAFDAARPILEFIANVVLGYLFFMMNLILATVVGLVRGVSNSIGSVLETLSVLWTGINHIFTGVIQVLTGLWDFLVGVFTLNREKILEGLQGMEDGAINIVVGMVESIIMTMFGFGLSLFEFISGLVSGVIEYFMNLYNELVGNSIIPDMVNDILMWIITMVTNIISYIVKFINDFVAKAIELRDSIVGKIIELKDQVLAKVDELWTGFIKKIVKAIQEILGMLEGFAKDIIKVFTETDWTSMGSSIIEGIIAGLEAGWNWVVEKASGLAGAAKEAWDRANDSNSPSKLYMQSFRDDIIGGMILGIDDGKNSLMTAMADLGNAAFSGITNDVSMNLPAELRPIQNAPSQQNINNRYEVNNSFTGSPQITDADMLQMTLSGFRG